MCGGGGCVAGGGVCGGGGVWRGGCVAGGGEERLAH